MVLDFKVNARLVVVMTINFFFALAKYLIIATFISQLLYFFIKIAFQHFHFTFAINGKLLFCLLNRLLMGYAPFVNQYLAFMGNNLIIQCLNPIFHCHGIHFQCLKFSEIQKC